MGDYFGFRNRKIASAISPEINKSAAIPVSIENGVNLTTASIFDFKT
jgi:hypothetical protein